MTQAEYGTAFSLWVIAASPLIVDADVRNLSAFQRSTLLHDEMLALHHDPLGDGGSRVGCASVDPPAAADVPCAAQVWRRRLRGNATAIALYNGGATPARLSFDFALLGYTDTSDTSALAVRDVWARRGLGVFRSHFTVSEPIPPHGTAVLRVSRPDDERGGGP
jgi:alpha-galactosidase